MRNKYQIEISYTVRKKVISEKQIVEIAELVLADRKIKSAYIDIAVVGDKYMQNLTEKYSGKRYRTDVLAFNLGDDENYELSAQIIVNAQLARHIARKTSVPAKAELGMYIIHGLLHLTGFDDHNAQDAEKMHKKTFDLLKKLNFKKLPIAPYTKKH